MKSCNGNDRNHLDKLFLQKLPENPMLKTKRISDPVLLAKLKTAVFSKKKKKITWY